jgi:hypothetical protein
MYPLWIFNRNSFKYIVYIHSQNNVSFLRLLVKVKYVFKDCSVWTFEEQLCVFIGFSIILSIFVFYVQYNQCKFLRCFLCYKVLYCCGFVLMKSVFAVLIEMYSRYLHRTLSLFAMKCISNVIRNRTKNVLTIEVCK